MSWWALLDCKSWGAVCKGEDSVGGEMEESGEMGGRMRREEREGGRGGRGGERKGQRRREMRD